MPPPEPIGEYVICVPDLPPYSLIQAPTSGATNELPAPVRLSSAFRAPAAPTAASAMSAAASSSETFVSIRVLLEFMFPADGRRGGRERGETLGERKVSEW